MENVNACIDCEEDAKEKTCDRCGNPMCRACGRKSEWDCCHACTVQIVNEESLKEKQKRLGDEVGAATYELGATIMRAQMFNARMDAKSA